MANIKPRASQNRSEELACEEAPADHQASTAESLSLNSQANSHDHSAFEELLLEILNDFEYTQRKEVKVQPENTTPVVSAPLKSDKMKEPLLFSPGVLMGILGPCGLPGHIAHFYDSNMEIEKHIKTIGELGHERFVKAYEYFKANLHVEAVLVYENQFMAISRQNGRLESNTFF